MMMIMTNLHMAETLNRIKLGKTSQLAPLLSILLSVREVMGLIPGLVKSDTVSQWLATATIFLQSCVAQVLRSEYGPCHTLHAWA